MKPRKQPYKDANIVGRNIERLRKEQGITQKDFVARMSVLGCDINLSAYSKLEGQIRIATDKEIYAAANILGVALEDLFESK